MACVKTDSFVLPKQVDFFEDLLTHPGQTCRSDLCWASRSRRGRLPGTETEIKPVWHPGACLSAEGVCSPLAHALRQNVSFPRLKITKRKADALHYRRPVWDWLTRVSWRSHRVLVAWSWRAKHRAVTKGEGGAEAASLDEVLSVKPCVKGLKLRTPREQSPTEPQTTVSPSTVR